VAAAALSASTLLAAALSAVTLSAILPTALYAQAGGRQAGVAATNDAEFGETAIAARYVDWAETAFREGSFLRAEAFLERAADYAPVSSDLSYLLALTRLELSRPARDTLASVHLALATDRWTLYSRADALRLEAEMLIRLRRYNEAFDTILALEEGERTAELRLLALEHLPSDAEFAAAMEAAFKRYPNSPQFLRILFRHAAQRPFPDARERALVDTALKRLPVLLAADGDLIRYAAPFIADRDEARRLLAAWRATGGNRKLRLEALPVCLEIGLIDERTAMDELFAASAVNDVDRNVLLAVWDLLRTDEAREDMAGRLAEFSGTVTGDANGDGITDSRAAYRSGALVSYVLDADQDGVDEMAVEFDSDGAQGWPARAELAYSDGGNAGGTERIALVWENYPAVSEAVAGNTRWFFRPMELDYPALSFRTAGGVLLLPDPEPSGAMFTRGMMALNAFRAERPGRDFPGAVEVFECGGGVVLSAKEYLDGRLVAETAYEGGLPVFRRIDLDLDGRMETVRRFRRAAETARPNIDEVFEIESIESDFDGDGVAEYSETH
jgi:hypothetical protein